MPDRDTQRFGCSTCGHFIGFITTEPDGSKTFPEWDHDDAGGRTCCLQRVDLLTQMKLEHAGEVEHKGRRGRARSM